ncbi:L%2CD-carboxypeptidase A [uncultured Clostridium sp.]|nr:L%2CD-carboxypeptidase A [uncultured Clostridium sp.]
MRYPQNLKKGGTIGFVAPSFGCATEPYKSAFLNAQKKFQEMGYQCQLGPNCYASEGIGISNTPEKCGKELTESYQSGENDCLISCGGGELMCEILEYVDFDAIREAPSKWYLGYSDNTNFTYLLTTLCDTASVYGPCAADFGMEPWHPSLNDTFGILTGEVRTVQNYDGWEKADCSLKTEETPLEPYHITEPMILKKYPDQDTVFEGRLLGGCLDCLVNLKGTEFDKTTEFIEKYKEDGILWFLEACELNVFSIRRAIWQLDHAGWFQYTKGFLIGRPMMFDQPAMGLDQYHAVTDLLAKYQVPVIMDVDLGHLHPAMPLITGSYANVRVEGNSIEIHMECR